MTFNKLQTKSRNHLLFRFSDILKWFPNDKESTIKQNLKRYVKKGLIERLVKGVYKLKETQINDEFFFSSFFDENSYISLESALSYYNLIPEYPYSVTAVSLKKTKRIKTPYGQFIYRKIKSSLFFGFKIISGDNYLYRLAHPEKALFDYIYLNQHQIKNYDYFTEMRLNIKKEIAEKTIFLLDNYLKNKLIISFFKKYVNNQ